MANKRMENWDAADFGRSFRRAASTSTSDTFQEKFNALADAVDPMESEFCRETVACGRGLASVMEDIQSIAARAGYCKRPRGFDQDCRVLYRDVDQAISRVESLREVCFI